MPANYPTEKYAAQLPVTLLRCKTSWTWAHFRAGCSFNPYPSHYSPAFASSNIPNPHHHRFTLR